MHEASQVRLQLLELLTTLLPRQPRSRVLDAATKWSSENSLIEALKGAALDLGVELLPIEVRPEELELSEVRLPIVHLGERPEIVLEWSKKRTLLKNSTGKVSRVPREEWNGRARTFLLRATGRELSPLAGSQGVRRVFRYFLLERGLLSTVLLFAVGYEALALAVPLAAQVLINNISFGMLVQPIIVLSLVLLVALAGASALRLLQVWAVENIVRRFVHRVALDLGTRKSSLTNSVRYPEHRFFEITTVDKAFFVVALDVTGMSLQVLAATILLGVYHPILLGFALALVISAWLVVRLPFRSALRRNLRESKAKYQIAAWLADGPSESDAVDRSLTGRMKVDQWIEARSAMFRISFAQLAAIFALEMVFGAALLIIGGRLVISGQLSLGQLVGAELVTTSALVSLSKLGKQMATVYDLVTSFEKLGHLVDHSSETAHSPPETALEPTEGSAT